MYAIDKLRRNPSFNMTGEEFNTIINSMTEEQESSSQVPIKLALVIRTTNSNLVAYQNEGIVCTSPILSHEAKGYFSVTMSVRKVIEKLFPKVTFEDVYSTVLMPIGVYKQHGELFVYMNLIIQDNQTDKFISPSMEYKPIKDLYLDFNLDSASYMVLPTLVITK